MAASCASLPPSKKIRRVLIANRGEVVLRIAKTLRYMGIESVAVFTDADQGAPFVLATDAAVPLGENKNYLNIRAVVAAGVQGQCDAVHPGYGFLAENPDFADAVVKAGLTFIGPSASTIRGLGSKAAAKTMLMESNSNVPVIPGYLHPPKAPALTVAQWAEKAAAVGYPVLIKAAAGGGGKGMRVVRDPAEFARSFDAVITEATGAFGDSTVLLERYFEGVRHIEVQILGDAMGHVAHLHERECSVQRRHQKLLEECPAASLDPALRRRICEAAVRVGRSANYSNAGTVEFIVDAAKGTFYFLEVNTRLQVEHAVTELCTGVDIVAAQVLLAQGVPVTEAVPSSVRRSDVYQAALPAPPSAATLSTFEPRGFAIEARLYAETDAFAPSVGCISAVAESTAAEYHTTVAPGVSVGVHYDGLLTKVIAYSLVSREGAITALASALRSTVVFGVQQSNRKALLRLLAHETVLSGSGMSTDSIDKGVITAEWLRAPLPMPSLEPAVAARRILDPKAVDPIRLCAALGSSLLTHLKATSARPSGAWRAAPAGWSNTTQPAMAAPRRLVASHDPETQLEVQRLPASVTGAQSYSVRYATRDATATVIAFNTEWDVAGTASSRGLRIHPQSRSVVLGRVTYLSGESDGQRPLVSELVVAQTTPADASLWAADDVEAPVLQVVHVQLMQSGNSFSFGVVDRHAGNVAVSRAPTGSLLPANYGTGSAATAASAGGPVDTETEATTAAAAANGTQVRSPIPAKVVRVEAPSGTKVAKDGVVVVLESMKMETKVLAPHAGIVQVRVKAGDIVQGNKVVFSIASQA